MTDHTAKDTLLGIMCYRYNYVAEVTIYIRSINSVCCVVPKVHVDNITVYENDGTVNISVEINGLPDKSILMNVVTVDGTAYG